MEYLLRDRKYFHLINQVSTICSDAHAQICNDPPDLEPIAGVQLQQGKPGECPQVWIKAAASP